VSNAKPAAIHDNERLQAEQNHILPNLRENEEIVLDKGFVGFVPLSSESNGSSCANVQNAAGSQQKIKRETKKSICFAYQFSFFSFLKPFVLKNRSIIFLFFTMLFLLQLSVYLSINKYPQVFRISYLLN
jgi:hypothetical protein